MISRRRFLASLGAGALGAPLASEAQQAGKVARIGWLGLASPGPEVLRFVDSFKQGLRQFGYVEGDNIAFEYRWAHGRSERLPALASELVLLKVDIIVSATTLGVSAAKQATSTTPIVFLGADPEALGLGSHLARPAGNVTGVAPLTDQRIAGKYLELLMEAVPKISRVVVLMRPESASHALSMKEIRAAARSFKIQLQPVRARTPDELDAAFAEMTRVRADALIALGDPIFFLHRQRLADLAAKNRLPAIYAQRENAEAGGLMAYGASSQEMARRAATYVDKILKGAKPGDLPIEQPTKFELVINLKTARALGLTIPRSVLSMADHVIQ